jgi:hypothetical protein
MSEPGLHRFVFARGSKPFAITRSTGDCSEDQR